MNFLIKSALTLGSLVGAQQAAKAIRRIDIDDALGYVGLERQTSSVPTVALVALSAPRRTSRASPAKREIAARVRVPIRAR